MSRKSKRTSAPTPMEIPPPVAQSGQPAPPPSIPSMFGPGVWCPPRPPQSMPPSSAPCWLTGVQQPGMASSSAQGPWWAPPGAGASAYPWSGPNNLEESDVQEWYVISVINIMCKYSISVSTKLDVLYLRDFNSFCDASYLVKHEFLNRRSLVLSCYLFLSL